MVERTRQVQSEDSFSRIDEAIDDPGSYETDDQTYEIERVAAQWSPVYDPFANDPVPLFLAGHADDRHPPRERYQDLPGYQELPEYAFAAGRKRKARGSRIVSSLLGLSAVAAFSALLSTDSTRAVIVNAKAALASAAPTPSSTARPDAAPRIQPVALASASPSRDEIAAAYQSAIKTRLVAAEPVIRDTAPAPRRIDANELAALLKRARSLLAIGDITSARLLLERAADAQEADAALILAGTYDPQVLGAQDMRSITPDPASARLWYQKAAQFGSPDAKRRLGQIQN